MKFDTSLKFNLKSKKIVKQSSSRNEHSLRGMKFPRHALSVGEGRGALVEFDKRKLIYYTQQRSLAQQIFMCSSDGENFQVLARIVIKQSKETLGILFYALP